MTTGTADRPEKTVAEFADDVMAMIADHQKRGILPAELPDLTTVHDYVDGNVYLIDALEGYFPRGDETAEVMFGDEEIAVSNAVSEEVDRRLRARYDEILAGRGEPREVEQLAAQFWASDVSAHVRYPGSARSLEQTIRLWLASRGHRWPERDFDALFMVVLDRWPGEDLAKWKGESS